MQNFPQSPQALAGDNTFLQTCQQWLDSAGEEGATPDEKRSFLYQLAIACFREKRPVQLSELPVYKNLPNTNLAGNCPFLKQDADKGYDFLAQPYMLYFTVRFFWEARKGNADFPVSYSEFSDDMRETLKRCVIYESENLRDVDFRGIDLSGIDLSGRHLNRSKFNRANLQNVDLSSANLTGAIFNRADLSGANLNGALMQKARLNGATIKGASLLNADLRDAGLVEADLSGARLNGANLSGAILIRCNLSGSDLCGLTLAGLDLHEANLSGANLVDSDLSGANLVRGALKGANLTNSRLTRANLIQADLTGANLSGTDLSRANLIGAVFTDETPNILESSANYPGNGSQEDHFRWRNKAANCSSDTGREK